MHRTTITVKFFVKGTAAPPKNNVRWESVLDRLAQHISGLLENCTKTYNTKIVASDWIDYEIDQAPE